MLKDLLEKQQPVVYRAFKNACERNRVSSAYLFTGPYGTPKKEAAILLAQSILCDEEGLACESCNTCRRVKEGTYADLIVLDGNETPISKDMVDELQLSFSKTALEEKGQRIYIILNAETASIGAQNSLLKFLEEPGEGITAILTADNINNLLPTIISRCTVLPFVPMKQEAYAELVNEAGVPKEDAYFLSYLARNEEDLDKMYPLKDGTRLPSFEYKSMIGLLEQYLDLREREYLLVDYEVSFRSKEKDRKKAKTANMMILKGFFTLLITYAHDAITRNEEGPQWYRKAVKNAYGDDEFLGKLIMIVADELDKVNRFNDINLVMDQAFFRLEELNHEYGR